tara:strand:+ start:354 stop:524 length:171 start_codon:yes stop_codon:yes gene_type:complete
MILELTASNQDSMSIVLADGSTFLFQQKTNAITLTEQDQASTEVLEVAQDSIVIFV